MSNTTIKPDRKLYNQVYEKFTVRLPSVILNSITSSKIERNYANQADYFQYHYARYLCGLTKAGHRAFFEFRAFINHELFKTSDYNELLSEIEQFLLEREMYESLIVFERTKKKFKKELNGTFNQTIQF